MHRVPFTKHHVRLFLDAKLTELSTKKARLGLVIDLSNNEHIQTEIDRTQAQIAVLESVRGAIVGPRTSLKPLNTRLCRFTRDGSTCGRPIAPHNKTGICTYCWKRNSEGVNNLLASEGWDREDPSTHYKDKSLLGLPSRLQ